MPSNTPDSSQNIASEIEVDDANQRHQLRMQRKKKIIDEKIASATIKRGLIVMNCGNGKGKSSSGLGMVMRALGHEKKVGVVQFIKGAMSTGEEKFLRRFPDEVEFHAMGEGYTWNTQDRERDVLKANLAWLQAQRFLRDPSISLVLLDEVNIALKYHYLDVDMVIADLQNRPMMQHVILTGRGALPSLIEIADTVTEMREVKHAFKCGVGAQECIEW
ncbi:cob(I)yrinic acid a,c-diamide adenosyltransferase [Undibacterium fentianense]|uniref:Corrinoid adenosyltransferase n=1 Tax=Undibacterium fentianense TaxID=2828728 RepID=A0A941DYF1_9BURK|nr:cob(I)yrinic acid a,c-diamide adenosyltransferase [Undibacterium fentianense]MBR7799060.1 cob(I)yrinic acid a,c-diamide adenosyltransferase [Undibacterium fentianense]